MEPHLKALQPKKEGFIENGRAYYKEVKRPKLFETYSNGAPSIDVHNHLRQDGLALEKVWKTPLREHRMINASLLGIIETNAHLAYQYFGENTIDHCDFIKILAR